MSNISGVGVWAQGLHFPYVYCVYMRPCARFSGGKRQFPDGQHHKKPPRLTTAPLITLSKGDGPPAHNIFWQFFPGSAKISYLADIYVPALGFNPKESWIPKRLSNKTELSIFIRNKLSQEEAHIPKSPKLSNDLFCCRWWWLDLQWSNCQQHPRRDGDKQVQMLAHQRIRSMGVVFFQELLEKSSTI